MGFFKLTQKLGSKINFFIKAASFKNLKINGCFA